MAKINKFEDLIIWKKGIELSYEVYQITSVFPKNEVFGLTSQLTRASVSIPSNIAEGFGRQSQREFKRFLRIAAGSLCELKTQIYLSEKLEYINSQQRGKTMELIEEISKMIHSILKKY